MLLGWWRKAKKERRDECSQGYWGNMWKLSRVISKSYVPPSALFLSSFVFSPQCLGPIRLVPRSFLHWRYLHAHCPTIPANTTLSEQATRVGFHALLFSTLIGLVTITVLPVAVMKVQSRMKICHLGSGLAELWCLHQGFVQSQLRARRLNSKQ